jgi:hypothetical protein
LKNQFRLNIHLENRIQVSSSRKSRKERLTVASYAPLESRRQRHPHLCCSKAYREEEVEAKQMHKKMVTSWPNHVRTGRYQPARASFSKTLLLSILRLFSLSEV